MKNKYQETLAWIEGLTVTQGPLAGNHVKLFPWEKRFLNGLLKSDTDTAALSIGRGNGKTTFLAAVAAAAVRGPLAQPRAEVVLIAASFDQAKIAFEHVIAFLEDEIAINRGHWRITSTGNRAEAVHKPSGIKLKARGSLPKNAHGLAPSLALLDEPAQWPANTANAMLAAITTSLGKIGGAKIVAMGTRPMDTNHWFQRWLDGAADFATNYCAKDDDPIFAKGSIRKANPSLPQMPELERVIMAEVERAKKDSGALQSYKALRLNLGTSDITREMLLDPDSWIACESVTPDRDGPCVWGMDLGTNAAMSAVAAYWPMTGWLEVAAAFPGDISLRERGDKDGVAAIYEAMARRGELITTPGRTVDIAVLMTFAMERFGPPAAVVSDRWRQAELLDALEAAGIPPSQWIPRGQGFKDGGDDVRRFRRCALEGRILTPESLLMRAAIGGAVTLSDPAGNAKLAKASEGERRARHRDDAIAAAILAVAEGDRGRSSLIESETDPNKDRWSGPVMDQYE